jgi:hypothetical protein
LHPHGSENGCPSLYRLSYRGHCVSLYIIANDVSRKFRGDDPSQSKHVADDDNYTNVNTATSACLAAVCCVEGENYTA